MNYLKDYLGMYDQEGLGGGRFQEGVPVRDPNRNAFRMLWARDMAQQQENNDFRDNAFAMPQRNALKYSTGPGMSTPGGSMVPPISAINGPRMPEAPQQSEREPFVNHLRQFLRPRAAGAARMVA